MSIRNGATSTRLEGPSPSDGWPSLRSQHIRNGPPGTSTIWLVSDAAPVASPIARALPPVIVAGDAGTQHEERSLSNRVIRS